jgi:hypothetical protein
LELGASIFVPANMNLWRASDEFNLTRKNFTEENYEMGIWNGERVVFTVCGILVSSNLESLIFLQSLKTVGGVLSRCSGDTG